MTLLPSKIKYLTNKDLLEEIHISKSSYCATIDSSYLKYDFIVNDINLATSERIEEARAKKLADMMSAEKKAKVSAKNKNLTTELSLDDVPIDAIVIRLMTHEHIPINPDKIGKAKTLNEKHMRCNFPPFQHFIMKDGELKCVLKSHWKGGLENGYFATDHGKMTNNLALMFMKLVDRYGHRGNWRGYTYLEEMKSQALLQLSQVGLQFDESRSAVPNPFSYFTQIVNTSFMRILNVEKKNQNIRDDILIMHGSLPSHTRMVENEMEQRNK